MIGGLADTRKGILLGLPAGLIVGFFFLYDRYALLLIIIFLRSSLDLVFDATKLGDFGLGAVLNGLVILIALIALAEKPDIARKTAKDVWLPFLIVSLASLSIAPDLVSGIKTYVALLTYASIFFLAVKLIKTEEDYARWMKKVLNQAIDELSIIAFVEARPKAIVSFSNKIISKDKYQNPLTDMTDLCGARVIVHFQSQVEKVCEFIGKNFEIDEANSLDQRSKLNVNEFS